MENVSLVDGHIDNGMSDEDIIKALECCLGENAMCELCPYDKHPYRSCMDNLLGDALDLINRKNADIEKLTIELQAMRGAANSYKAEVEGLKEFIEKDTGLILKLTGVPVNEYNQKIKSEAIKEFAERLKSAEYYTETGVYCLDDDDIDNLVKEMTESK